MKDLLELNSSRLHLRKMQISDFPDLVKYAGNKKISDQIINIPYPYTDEDAIERMHIVNQGLKTRQRYIFAITLQGQDNLIGEIGLHIERANNAAQIGYWVAEPWWGQGIATEALALILRFGFQELKLHKIYATHYPENPSSAKVMIKNNMIKEAELKDHYLIDGVYRSIVQYRLTDEEWIKVKS